MTPLDRLRIEKAAADCGFEMTPTERGGGLELRSVHFPEAVVVRQAGPAVFAVVAPSSLLPDATDGTGTVMVTGFAVLYDVLRTAVAHGRTRLNRVTDTFRTETAGLPRTTEAERLVVQRVGQNLFRAALLDYWQGRCCVTGLDIPELLRASHIMPWAACESDDERLNMFNGLLLAPHVDALFDGGWVSFSNDGRILISNALPVAAAEQLGVTRDWTIRNLKPAHGRYLEFHRLHELRKAP